MKTVRIFLLFFLVFAVDTYPQDGFAPGSRNEKTTQDISTNPHGFEGLTTTGPNDEENVSAGIRVSEDTESKIASINEIQKDLPGDEIVSAIFISTSEPSLSETMSTTDGPKPLRAIEKSTAESIFCDVDDANPPSISLNTKLNPIPSSIEQKDMTSVVDSYAISTDQVENMTEVESLKTFKDTTSENDAISSTTTGPSEVTTNSKETEHKILGSQTQSPESTDVPIKLTEPELSLRSALSEIEILEVVEPSTASEIGVIGSEASLRSISPETPALKEHESLNAAALPTEVTLGSGSSETQIPEVREPSIEAKESEESLQSLSPETLTTKVSNAPALQTEVILESLSPEAQGPEVPEPSIAAVSPTKAVEPKTSLVSRSSGTQIPEVREPSIEEKESNESLRFLSPENPALKVSNTAALPTEAIPGSTSSEAQIPEVPEPSIEVIHSAKNLGSTSLETQTSEVPEPPTVAVSPTKVVEPETSLGSTSSETQITEAREATIEAKESDESLLPPGTTSQKVSNAVALPTEVSLRSISSEAQISKVPEPSKEVTQPAKSLGSTSLETQTPEVPEPSIAAVLPTKVVVPVTSLGSKSSGTQIPEVREAKIEAKESDESLRSLSPGTLAVPALPTSSDTVVVTTEATLSKITAATDTTKNTETAIFPASPTVAQLSPCTEAGNFSNPINCHTFTFCSGNVTSLSSQEIKCPERLAFSPAVRRCTRDLSPCGNVLPTCLESGSIADPLGNSSYYWCIPSLLGGYHKYHIVCATNEIYNTLIGRCWSEDPLIGLENFLPSDRDLVRSEWKQLKKEIKLKVKEEKIRRKMEAKVKARAEKLAAKEQKKQKGSSKTDDDDEEEDDD